MKNPLVELVEGNQEKIFALFEQSGGRLNFEERKGEKGEFLEVKVLNEQARLAGILWFFGPRRAYIEDIRLMVKRKENQKVAMVLLAGDGTTSAGKKELRDVGIKIIKDIDLTEIEVKKKKKKKVAKKKEVEFTDSEDVSLANVPDTPLIKNAKILIERREPEFINIKEIKGAEDETHEFRAYSTTNDILAIYRTVNHDSIGVSAIRDFATAVEEYENISLALVGLDKFTPSAKKEATEKGINLISIAEEIESRGSEEQQQLSERLKDGAIDIINQRGYKVMSNTGAKFSKLFAGSESLGTYLVAQNDNKDVLLVLIPSEEVVRVATVRDFALQIESLKIKEGMLIALKRFTYTAEREARDLNIIALKKNHPVFNIFSHFLVPDHELMTPEEINEMLITHNAKINQLPRIYDDDPGVVAVNGKVGEVIRIIRAEGSLNFRLIVPRPESGMTESTAMVELQEMTKKQRMKKKKAPTKQIDDDIDDDDDVNDDADINDDDD